MQISNRLKSKIENAIDRDFEDCTKVAKVYIEKAKDLGISFKNLLCNERNIRILRARLNLLTKDGVYCQASYVLD